MILATSGPQSTYPGTRYQGCRECHRIAFAGNVFACPGRCLAIDLGDAGGEQGKRVRVCMVCGGAYDRGLLLRELERRIRDRYRVPSSPWSGAELAEECDL